MSLRNIAKRTVKSIFLIIAYPLFLWFLVVRTLTGSDNCFATFSQFLSLVPGKIGTYLRAAFYHLACPDTSDDIYVGFQTLLSHRNTSIAHGVYIGPQCNIGMCSIGEHTLIGSGVHVLSGSRQHDFSDSNTPIQKQGGVFEKIAIGSDCWAGNASIIMAPLANQTIVAAGSVVTKLSNPGDILVGNPARPIRNRNTPTNDYTIDS